MRARFGSLLVFLALALGTVAAARRMPAAQERPYDLDVLPTPMVARVASFGHALLAANITWLRVVQYLGEPLANARGWDRLYPAIDLVTDLDPRHGYAYQVGGVVLSSVDRLDESNRLLEKGARNVPNRYILPYYRAFNAFYYDGDYAEAGVWAERAANTPGAPAHLRQNVLAMYVKGRHADAAIAFLRDAYEVAQDDESRKALREQLEQAIFEREAAIVDSAAERYRERFGIAPPAPGLLVASRMLPALPDEPFGGSWYFGDDGRARSTTHARRLAAPEKPRANREPLFDPGAMRRRAGEPSGRMP
jgi:tetratricopeptide (TPR) repeat protein